LLESRCFPIGGWGVNCHHRQARRDGARALSAACPWKNAGGGNAGGKCRKDLEWLEPEQEASGARDRAKGIPRMVAKERRNRMIIESKDYRLPSDKRVELRKWPTVVDPYSKSKKEYKALLQQHMEKLSAPLPAGALHC
jgi:hypothetical protein